MLFSHSLEPVQRTGSVIRQKDVDCVDGRLVVRFPEKYLVLRVFMCPFECLVVKIVDGESDTFMRLTAHLGREDAQTWASKRAAPSLNSGQNDCR